MRALHIALVVALGVTVSSQVLATEDANRVQPAGPEDAGEVLAAQAAPPTPTPLPEAPAPVNLSQFKKLAVTTSWSGRLMSLLGLGVLLGIAFALSRSHRRVDWRLVAWGLGLQFLFGLLVIKTSLGEQLFSVVNSAFMALLSFTEAGSSFLFGNLARTANVPVGAAAGPFAPIQASGNWASVGATFAFGVLPTIVFFSSLMTVLYHLGVMQHVVRVFAWVMQKTMRTSGAETLSAAGNIFVGQTEAPLLIKPYVATMTLSELMAVMVGGFATVAGGVMAAYVGMLHPFFPDIAGHLLSASVMSAPAALVCAKLMWPEDGDPVTRGTVRLKVERIDANLIDAASRGAGDGLKLALNVGAMLLAFIALVAMANALIGLPALWHNQAAWGHAVDALGRAGLPLPAGCAEPDGALALKQCLDQVLHDGTVRDVTSWMPWSMERILGILLAPLAWLMGVPWQDAPLIGSLLGVKTILNEFVAYQQLAGMLASNQIAHPRSIVIATYALCGFANFGSIAIQIGGIGGIAPERRQDLARMGLRAMIGGTLAAFMTATVAGMLL
ncbi:MAG: nucleoside transporter C-terminal domain-containing protein [Pseudomonadota bacterium]